MHCADYAVTRHLSLCPSVTCRYSVETVQHIIKLFSPSGRHTILVFANIMTIFRRGLHNVGVECRGGTKKYIFSKNISYISDIIQDTVIFITESE